MEVSPSLEQVLIKAVSGALQTAKRVPNSNSVTLIVGAVMGVLRTHPEVDREIMRKVLRDIDGKANAIRTICLHAIRQQEQS